MMHSTDREPPRQAEDRPEEAAGGGAGALHRQRRLYEAILSNTPDLAYIFDLDHRFIYANDVLLRMWGKSWDEAIGRNCLELGYEPWHAAMHDREIEQVVATRQPIRGVVPFSGTFGRRIYDYIFVPVLNERGEVEAVAGTTRDVTDMRQAEEAARASDERLTMALAAARMVTWQRDAASGDTVFSDNAAEVFGLTPGTTTPAHSAVALEALVHPGDADRRRSAIATATADASRYVTQFRIVRPGDGEILWLEERGQAVTDAKGRLVRLVGLDIDITERKRAEQALLETEMRFRTLADSAPVLMWRTDAAGVAFVNRHYLSFFGVPYEAVAGMGWADFLHPDGAAAYVEAYTSAYARRADYEFQCRFRRFDGEYRWLHNVGSPHVGADGEFLGFIGCSADVTEIKKAEQAVRDSEQRYRALVTASSEVAYRMSADWSVMYPLDGRGLVRSSSEPIRDWLTLNIPASEHARITEAVATSIATKSAFQLEHRVVRADGSIGWTSSRAVPMLDDRGQVVEWFGSAADITDRKRAEEALQEREQRFRQMADSIPQLAWYANADGWITWFNRRWYDYTGTTPKQMEGWGWQSVHDPDVLPRVLERWRASIASGRPFEMEFPIRGADGVFRPFLTRVAPLRDDTGTVVQWFGTNTDVTDQHHAAAALRASEQQLRQMADTMAHMIWVTGPDGYHEWYNRRWYEFTGAAEGSTDGEGWNGMFHPDDQARAWALWRHCLATGDDYEIEYRLKHHSGGYRWVQGRALPVRNEHGQIERWFGTCTDIHDMRQLIDEREHLLESEQAARVESERASRMKDDFLATLSHEIRTPLNAILGWAIVLRSGRASDGAAAQAVEVIERNARLQAQMIEDLLDMSRIISGKLRLDVQRIDLADVIRAAAATVEPAAAAKDIRVQLVLDPLAGPVSGDPNRLQQVCWNLLSNAIKFTPRGGRVQVLLERINSHLEISVIDTGEGIEPAFLPHIFGRFRQADATTTRRHGGLGLGLAIVKQLIELHGGTIRAKSPGVGQGATFTAALPLTVIHPEVEPPRSREHPAAGTGPVTLDRDLRFAGVRVLVVDDEPDARMLLSRLFEERDAVVFTASSAQEALSILQATRPDVLISDIGMPQEDGFTLIRRVRALPAGQGGRTPAVALTAYARSEDRVKALVAGFQHHLSKPIEPMELMVTVASLMDLP